MNTDDFVKMMEANPPGAMSVSGQPAGNPYLKMMEDNEAETQSRFAASTNLAATTNPEEEARKKRIADLIGVPVSAVEGNPDLAKQMASQKKLTEDTKDAPGLRKKYTDVDFAKLAHDQSAHLGIIERTLRNFAAGFGGDLAGSAVKGLGHTVNSIERFLIDGERFDPYTGESYNLYERTRKGEAPPLGQGLVDVGKIAKDYWQGLAPTDETTFSDMVVRGVGQISGQLSMMVASPEIGLAMMYGQGADQMMEKIEKDKTAQKASQTAQDIEVLSGGVITAATEWAASKLLLKPPQLLMLKNRLLNYSAKIALGGAEEGIQETLENIGQDLSHIALTNPESKVAWGEAVQAGEVGGVVGAITSSVINGALHIRARGVQRAFANLSDSTKAQQLKDRDPGTYQDFADAVTAHLSGTAEGAVENIYIDANTFHQAVAEAGVDPDAVAKLVPSISEQLDEARVTGGDLVIPLNEFVGKIAGTDLGDMLGQHLRSTPESPSLAELEAASKISNDLQKKAEEIMKKKKERSEFAKSTNAVNKIIFDQIQSTGVYTTPVSRAYASMVRDFYVTRADELGMSPMEVYEAYPYRIVGGEVGQQSTVTQNKLGTDEAYENSKGSAVDKIIETAKASPEIEALEYSIARSLSQELQSNTDIPSGSITGPQWVSTLREDAPDLYAKLDEAGFIEPLRTYNERIGRSEIPFVGKPPELYQSAWHGSPYTFDKFSTKNIGTGEGASAYGYGLYFAERKEVAKWYKKNLEKAVPAYNTFNGKRIRKSDLPGIVGDSSSAYRKNMESALRRGSDVRLQIDKEIAYYQNDVDRLEKRISEREKDRNAVIASTYSLEDYREMLQHSRKTVDKLKKMRDKFGYVPREKSGKLYKVELAPEENEYLLWDKPLSGQSEKVKNALEDIKNAEGIDPMERLSLAAIRGEHPRDKNYSPTGEDIYNYLADEKGSQQAASEYLHSLGIRGIKYLDAASRESGEGHYNYVIFSDDDVAIQEMYQRMADQKRGGFDPLHLMTILTEKADYSTFLHETAHFFLSTYAEMAFRPNATPRMIEDMRTLLDWFDVPDLHTWHTLSLDEQRKHHEAFAYNYEIYVFEGKAPNVKMQGLFQRFSAWLKKVYASIRGEINNIYKSEHGVDLPILTGEVRQVMDRMIASDKQIQQAEQIRGMAPIFATQEDANMTDEEWSAYQALQQEAHNAALEAHQAASLRQIKWLSKAKSSALKALQEEAQEIRKWITSEVIAEINAQPIYRAKEFLETSDEAESLALADALGFASVAELETAIANAPRKKDVIRQNVDARMLEEYGEFTDPKALADAVDQAVHNEARARFIGVELRHLSKTQRPVRVMQEAARQAARAILGKRAINTIKPAAFTAAEAKASNAAEKAMKEGDTATATQAKEHQLLQNQLASEAMKANAIIFKALDNFKKVFASDKRLSKSRDMNYVNTARAILAQYGFGTTEEPASFYLAKIKAYDPEFFAEVEPMITAHQLQAPSVTTQDLKSARPIDKLTLDEFIDLSDQISALWHLSRRNKQIEIDGKLMERTAIVEELNDQIRLLNSSFGRIGYNKAVTTWEEAKIKLMGMRASMRRVEAWISAMDKGQTDGVFRRYIWNPISESVVQYRMAKSDYMNKYIDMLKDAGPLLKGPDIISPELNYTFKPQELLHALLHTGNISNKRKLLLGREWASLLEDGKTVDSSRWDAFITRLQDNGTLTKEHYDFAQKVWNLLEQMKPAAQKAHREIYGFYFNEITATPFETPYGIYAGGYVPAVTDSTMVTEGAMRNEQETQSVDNSYMFPTTGRGFTKGRIEYNKPLLLNLGYLPAHMDKVLRFTHIEPRIKDVGRIVKTNKAFASTMDEFDPTVRGDMLVPWLQRTAMQMVSMPSKGWGGKAADTVFRYLRVNTGFQMMVGNITNTLQQFTGISISALKVRPALLRNALWQYIRHPKDTAEMIIDKSDYMKTRMNSDMYELIQTIDELLLDPDKYDKLRGFIRKHGYFMQTATQGIVDNITWAGAYNQAIEGNADEKEAVRQADAAVRMTQGSFAPEDVSRIETGSAFMRAFTHFYSYFNMQANILGTEFLNVSRNLGVKNGAGKLLYIYVFGFMIPAVLSEMIVQAAGGFDDGDDDEYDLWDAMRLFFSAQARPLAAMAPGIGPAAIAMANVWNDKQYDDRLSTSPAVSTIESAVRAPHSVYKAIAEDGSWKRGAKDLLTLLGLVTNLPLGQLGKPVGYALDVEQGRTTPQSTGDYARGLLSGKDVNKKQ